MTDNPLSPPQNPPAAKGFSAPASPSLPSWRSSWSSPATSCWTTLRIPAAPTYPLDIAQIRQLAQGDASLLPVRLNILSLGQGDMPQFMVFAGGGLKTIPMPVPVFQVVYPDHTVMVDTGMDQTSFTQMFGGASFSAASYDQLQSAMRSCQTILLTTSTSTTLPAFPPLPTWTSCSQAAPVSRAV